MKHFDFPIWLQGSTEEQAAEEQRQTLLRASFTRAKLSESERLIGQGYLLEQTARENLKVSKGRDRKARIFAQNQLADGLALQGKFSEAAKIHNDKHARKHYRNVVKAINLPDDLKCKCPDSRAGNLSITPRFERERIVSPAHNNEAVSVVQCKTCGHQNARPLRSRLLPMKAALAENEAAARTANPRFLNDKQVLGA